MSVLLDEHPYQLGQSVVLDEVISAEVIAVGRAFNSEGRPLMTASVQLPGGSIVALRGNQLYRLS